MSYFVRVYLFIHINVGISFDAIVAKDTISEESFLYVQESIL